jgi:tRNA-specific 2-thiouridylase
VTDDGLLRAAADPAKDQSYMLAGMSPQTIARMRFPLGELTKDRVRAIAAEHGLPVASKPDSQDLCFLAGTGRARFLERHGGIGDSPGAILDRRGNVLGRHRGAHRFTVGQRRGLEVGGAGEPLYVLKTDVAAGTVTVGPRAELATTEVRLRDVVLHRGADTVEAVKLRYRSPSVACTLEGDVLRLAEAFSGAAPGQVAVLLRGDAIVGSGTISS